MALIKCIECGNEVSDRAEFCPNCGNPISQKKNNMRIDLGSVLLLVGGVLIFFAPLLTYVKVRLDLLTETSVEKYNMWEVLSEEAGGIKSGENIGVMGMVPTIILILGLVLVIVAILSVIKRVSIPVLIAYLIPSLVMVLFILFEVVGLQTFRETNNTFAEVFAEYDLGNLVSIEKGVGFFTLIVGIIICIIANIKKKKSE